MFHPEEILAAGQALGDRHRDLRLPLAGPRQGSRGNGRALLEDLEPHVAAAVEGCGRLAAGYFGHVELEGARVRDGGLRGEAEGGAGGDFVRGLRGGAGGELVAADLVRGDLGWG